MAKKNAGPHAGQVNYVLNDIQSDPSLVTQLGPDFETFVRNPSRRFRRRFDQALESFLTNWFTRYEGKLAGCHISILRVGSSPNRRYIFFCQKPQQNRLSSLSTPQIPLTPPYHHIPPKDSWHSSFPPARIIKTVGNKQTRPKRRAFAFNAPSTSVANQRVIRKPNRMNAYKHNPRNLNFHP